MINEWHYYTLIANQQSLDEWNEPEIGIYSMKMGILAFNLISTPLVGEQISKQVMKLNLFDRFNESNVKNQEIYYLKCNDIEIRKKWWFLQRNLHYHLHLSMIYISSYILILLTNLSFFSENEHFFPQTKSEFFPSIHIVQLKYIFFLFGIH